MLTSFSFSSLDSVFSMSATSSIVGDSFIGNCFASFNGLTGEPPLLLILYSMLDVLNLSSVYVIAPRPYLDANSLLEPDFLF